MDRQTSSDRPLDVGEALDDFLAHPMETVKGLFGQSAMASTTVEPTTLSARDFNRAAQDEKDRQAPGDQSYSYRPLETANSPADLEGGSPSMVLYTSITAGATIIEDINVDCWGALFFAIVSDLPDWKSGRISKVGKVRVVFSFVVFVLNLFIQSILLFYICKLLMMPDMLSAQNLYKLFTQRAFKNGVVNDELFENLSTKYRDEVCGLALSQAVFARVILFLWVTTNVGELRNNYIKMSITERLPILPEDLDTRLMVMDSPDPDEPSGRVVCLDHGSKMWLLLLIFIPKFMICIFLTITGCLWLMAAENIGDLILNSLALAFVVQVDELLAQVFFPQFYLQDLGRLDLAAQKQDKDQIVEEKTQLEAFAHSTMTLFLTAFVVELVIRFQPVIPGYNSKEVSVACGAFVEKQVPWCMPGRTDCFKEA